MDQYFDSKLVYFLEYPDFNREGQFVHSLGGKKMVVMVGGSFCSHCKHTAPTFNDFAKKVKGDVVLAVIQVDGSDSERALGKLIGEMAQIRGIPSFLLFDEEGKYMKKHDGERSVEGFLEFLAN